MAKANFSEKDLRIAFSILKYLHGTLHGGSVSEDSKESLEVAIMCLQEVYGLSLDDPKYGSLPLLEDLIEGPTHSDTIVNEVSEDKQEEAEKLKNEGNDKLKQADYVTAIALYTRAIELAPSNAPYYANRAAAYIKTNELQKALTDCQQAVQLNPQYARAYGRMGLIYNMLSQPQQARESFQKAIELDPNNIEYKTTLEKLDAQLNAPQPERPQPPPGMPRMPGMPPGMPGMPPGMPDLNSPGINSLLSNPAFMNLATSVMSNPTFVNMASHMFQQQPGGASGGPGMGLFNGMNVAEMMPQLAEMSRHMQESNPAAYESLREQAAAQFQAQHDDVPEPPPKDEN